MTLLRFEGVELALGRQPVLRGVDLELREGEVLGLVGRNGAGKTTLLRVATRILEPDAGRVRVQGRPASGLARRELARALAVVPQETRVPFPFSALEVVLMGRAPHLGWLGFESERDVTCAREAMRALGIDHLCDRSVLDLSGGERQLVMVARGFAQSAPVLLLDEPTASLDLRHRTEVLTQVRERVRAGGCGALLVSHDLDLAARSCNRLALLADGAVIASGSPGEVLTRENLRRAYDVEAEILAGPDGLPVIVPRRPASRA